MAELMSVMDSEQWQKSTGNLGEGFAQYTVVHGATAGSYTWRYAVKQLPPETHQYQQEAHPEVVILHGARADPLSQVRNCDLILDKVGNKPTIIGINIDGDCVMRKSC